MKIYGLYGKSGMGKSHKSSEVIARYKIDAVIDDGLLIRDKMRVAGTSAKNERTMYASTKRAIFLAEDHRREVADYIAGSDIGKLLIIGTSQKMVRRIAEQLGLPQVDEWIAIERFQSDEELKLARERRGKGYHVIPVQPIEIGSVYSGAWFRGLVVRWGKRKAEVTLIKPTYLAGKIMIDPKCLHDIVHLCAIPGMAIRAVKVEPCKVSVALAMKKGIAIGELREWRSRVEKALALALGMTYAVQVEWESILG